jgi:hypothetical protein
MLNWQTGIVVGLAGITLMFVLFVLAFSWYDRNRIESRISGAADELREDMKRLGDDLQKASRSVLSENFRTAGELGRLAAALQRGVPGVAMLWHTWAAMNYARGLIVDAAASQLSQAEAIYKAIHTVFKLDYPALRNLEYMFGEIPDHKDVADIKVRLAAFLRDLTGLERPNSQPEPPITLRSGTQEPPPSV